MFHKTAQQQQQTMNCNRNNIIRHQKQLKSYVLFTKTVGTAGWQNKTYHMLLYGSFKYEHLSQYLHSLMFSVETM